MLREVLHAAGQYGFSAATVAAVTPPGDELLHIWGGATPWAEHVLDLPLTVCPHVPSLQLTPLPHLLSLCCHMAACHCC